MVGARPFGFAADWGYQTDSDTGLQRLGHRFYDPSTGRFLSRDPIRDAYNWYDYCDNDPLNYVDPEGQAYIALGFNLGFAEIGIKIPDDWSDFHITGSLGWSIDEVDDIARDVLKAFGKKLLPITFGYEPRPEVQPEAGGEWEVGIGVGEVGLSPQPGVETGWKGVGVAYEWTTPAIFHDVLGPGFKVLQDYIMDRIRPDAWPF